MSNLKRLAVPAVMTLSMFISGVAVAGVSGNIGATSNYVWRGLPQSGDDAAISGGLDYSSDMGIYVGTWTSSIGGGGQYEIDYYGGYSGETNGIGYDVGAILYSYPIDSSVELDFTEVYLSGSYSYFSAKYSDIVNAESSAAGADDGSYIEVAMDYPLPQDYSLGVHFGSASGDFYPDDYTDWMLSVSKDEFTFSFTGTDLDGNAGDPRAIVSWGKEF